MGGILVSGQDYNIVLARVAERDRKIAALKQRVAELEEENANTLAHLEGCNSNRRIVTAERDRLRADVEKLRRVEMQGRIRCHVAPVQEDIERNKIKEPEGEKLRAELIDWLEKNGIVSLILDTPEHVIYVDRIGKLPPRICALLTLWGSIYVKDPDGMRLAMYTGAPK